MDFGDAYLRQGLRRAGVTLSIVVNGIRISTHAVENTTDEDLLQEVAAGLAGRVDVFELETGALGSTLTAGAVVTRESDGQAFTVVQTRAFGDGRMTRVWVRK